MSCISDIPEDIHDYLYIIFTKAPFQELKKFYTCIYIALLPKESRDSYTYQYGRHGVTLQGIQFPGINQQPMSSICYLLYEKEVGL